MRPKSWHILSNHCSCDRLFVCFNVVLVLETKNYFAHKNGWHYGQRYIHNRPLVDHGAFDDVLQWYNGGSLVTLSRGIRIFVRRRRGFSLWQQLCAGEEIWDRRWWVSGVRLGHLLIVLVYFWGRSFLKMTVLKRNFWKFWDLCKLCKIFKVFF